MRSAGYFCPASSTSAAAPPGAPPLSARPNWAMLVDGARFRLQRRRSSGPQWSRRARPSGAPPAPLCASRAGPHRPPAPDRVAAVVTVVAAVDTARRARRGQWASMHLLAAVVLVETPADRADPELKQSHARRKDVRRQRALRPRRHSPSAEAAEGRREHSVRTLPSTSTSSAMYPGVPATYPMHFSLVLASPIRGQVPRVQKVGQLHVAGSRVHEPKSISFSSRCFDPRRSPKSAGSCSSMLAGLISQWITVARWHSRSARARSSAIRSFLSRGIM